MRGTVKFFDPLKGYGFIEPDGTKDDHFVHRNDLVEGVSLDKGDRVEFHSELGDRGLKATNVKVIE
ncbi:MAG: cold shock domain-containing protein [Candidatus Saliniplasma sp.]